MSAGAKNIMSVARLYKYGHFISEEQARGAFELAHQQGLDGLGESIHQWMGLTQAQFDFWVRDGTIPKRKDIRLNPDRAPKRRR